MIQVIVRILANVVGKSGHEKGTIKMVCAGHGNGNSIAVRPVPDLCREQVIPGRVVDHPDNPTSIPFHSDGDTIGGEPVSEVGRAVKRIDDLFVTGGSLLGEPTLFGKNRMGWERVVDHVDDPLFRLMVGISDKVEELLVFNANTAARAFDENGAGLAGRINGNRKERVEGNILVMREGHGAAS